ncbi:cytochrome c [Aureisphaera galaxeae]|uniref:c-type cytochrome n=1 Tax=Aureisphaera galaxeae TaxID=1538023 RepID=UPI0023503265|nr:cytochrome c [Aureisphaera galaxeae]MDC8005284.1 cytochrome c [Aureisphaera galaxeae]
MFKRLAYTLFILLGSVFVFVIAASFSLFSFTDDRAQVCGNEDPIVFCGTEPIVFSEQGEKGRRVFQANCAACHKLNKPSTGPALLGVHKKEPREGFFFEYITNGYPLLKAKDPYVMELKEMYPADYAHKFQLSDEEYENLMAYIKGI